MFDELGDAALVVKLMRTLRILTLVHAVRQPLLRPEYGDKAVTRATAPTLEELAAKMEGLANPAAFLKTVKEFNAAVRTDVPFNHSVKDGRSTVGAGSSRSRSRRSGSWWKAAHATAIGSIAQRTGSGSVAMPRVK